MAQRSEGFALGESPYPQSQAFLGNQDDPTERGHDLDVVNGGTGGLKAIRLMKPDMYPLGPVLSEDDGLVDEAQAQGLFEGGEDGVCEQRRKQKGDHRVRHGRGS